MSSGSDVSEAIREVIRDGKFVELTYKVTDGKSTRVRTCPDFLSVTL